MQKENLGSPFWINGDFKWYFDTRNQIFLTSRNDFNMPPLKNLQCCIVINEKENINDFVLIDNKQNIICSYTNPTQQHEYETKIKMFKVKKHYDECEGIETEF